jgi:hypothetical protein
LQLTEPGRLLDQELAAPEGMFEPMLIHFMNKHADCELSHSDFLQHWAETLWNLHDGQCSGEVAHFTNAEVTA